MLSCGIMVTVNKRFCRMVSQNYDYWEIETIILKVQTSDDHAVGLLYVLHGMILALQGLILMLLDCLR